MPSGTKPTRGRKRQVSYLSGAANPSLNDSLRPEDNAVEPIPGEELVHAFSELARSGSDAPDVTSVQQQQLTSVLELTKARACFVSRHDAGRDMLLVTAVRGRNDARITATRPAEGVVGTAFSASQIQRGDGVLSIPLVSRGSTLGCLTLLSPRREVTDSLAAALAVHFATALESAALRDEAARRTKDLQTAVEGLRSVEKAREELLSNVSHDLKNPLTTIKGYLAMLSRGGLGPIEDPQRRALAACERNADRLLRLINDLLLSSRLEAGDMQLSDRPFGLKNLCEEVLRSLSGLAEGLQVKAELVPSSEVFVRGDEARLREAVINLVEHAAYRSPPGSSIQLEVSTAGGTMGQVRISDPGPTITAGALRHIFDPLPLSGGPRKVEALGLPVAARIAQLHGGRMEAFSKEGRTTFEMDLPMFAGALAQPGEPGQLTGDVLVVEDDVDCREVVQQILELEGYSVRTARTMEEAQQALHTRAPALVLLDLRLSQQDGMSVLRYIRRMPELNETRVYIISGARDIASLSNGSGDERIDGFFEKPLQMARLLDTVGSIIRPIRSDTEQSEG